MSEQDFNDPRTIAKEEIRTLFYRLGYDLTTPIDMRELSKDLEWIQTLRKDLELEKDLEWIRTERKKDQENSANAIKALWIVISATVGAVVTVLAEWFRPH